MKIPCSAPGSITTTSYSDWPLPIEIYSQIFTRIPLSSIQNTALVCKEWYQALQDKQITTNLLKKLNLRMSPCFNFSQTIRQTMQKIFCIALDKSASMKNFSIASEKALDIVKRLIPEIPVGNLFLLQFGADCKWQQLKLEENQVKLLTEQNKKLEYEVTLLDEKIQSLKKQLKLSNLENTNKQQKETLEEQIAKLSNEKAFLLGKIKTVDDILLDQAKDFFGETKIDPSDTNFYPFYKVIGSIYRANIKPTLTTESQNIRGVEAKNVVHIPVRQSMEVSIISDFITLNINNLDSFKNRNIDLYYLAVGHQVDHFWKSTINAINMNRPSKQPKLEKQKNIAIFEYGKTALVLSRIETEETRPLPRSPFGSTIKL